MFFIPRFREAGRTSFENIEGTEVWRPKVLERRVGVVLRVNGGITSAVKYAGVVLLLAMIRQRLPRDLAARDTAAVRKCSDKQCID